jgi:DNA polymerase
MTSTTDRTQRVARQHLRTAQLFGLDFVPIDIDRSARAGAENDEDTQDHDVGSATRNKTEALETLRQEHAVNCPHCTVATAHTNLVFGEGDPDAGLMFIGEAPGEEEDKTGRPFVGRAGQKLNEMIQAMGLQREDVYIANILKSRPPNNRAPLRNEIDACAPYLAQQIRLIRPKVIVTLGNPSTKFMLRTEIGITKMRGQWASYVDGDLEIDVMPTFHPAFLLRNYTTDTRRKVWADLQAVMNRLSE